MDSTANTHTNHQKISNWRNLVKKTFRPNQHQSNQNQTTSQINQPGKFHHQTNDVKHIKTNPIRFVVRNNRKQTSVTNITHHSTVVVPFKILLNLKSTLLIWNSRTNSSRRWQALWPRSRRSKMAEDAHGPGRVVSSPAANYQTQPKQTQTLRIWAYRLLASRFLHPALYVEWTTKCFSFGLGKSLQNISKENHETQ